jgi:hypothetical protein
MEEEGGTEMVELTERKKRRPRKADNSYVVGFGVTCVILLLAALVGIWLTFGYGIKRGNDIEDEVDDIWHFIKKDLEPTLRLILLNIAILDDKVDALQSTSDQILADTTIIKARVNEIELQLGDVETSLSILTTNVANINNSLIGEMPPARVLCGQMSALDFSDFPADTPVNIGMELLDPERFPTSMLPGGQIAYNADEGEFEVTNMPDGYAVPLLIQVRVLLTNTAMDNTFRLMVVSNNTNCVLGSCPSSFLESRERYLSANQQFGTNTMEMKVSGTVNARNGDKFYVFMASKGAIGIIPASENEDSSVCAADFISFQPQTRMFFQLPA